ncbi:MAG: sigma-70 family RNA polymerase sigma factor [candidate division WOR-3 bacterium]|nr:sigma-70 family RNA polymerase sigma factor [candidate division WOR-3 bacterium]
MRKKLNKKRSFEEIYREYSDVVFSIAFKILKDVNLAEDVVVETFEKFEKYYHLIGDNAVYIWLKTTARNKAIDYLREREKSLSLTDENIPDKSLNPQEIFLARSEWEKILEIAKKYLNKKLYEIYDLYFLKSYSIKDIAKIKNMSEGAIKNSIFKIRRIIYQKAPKSIKDKYLKKGG